MRFPAVTALLIANIVVFGLQMQTPNALIPEFALWPFGHGFGAWQILTSAFLHGSVLHLGVNMLGVWMFGRELEQVLGTQRFLLLYLLSVVAAAVTQLVVSSLTAPIPTVGASGGLMGLLGAYALLFPRRQILLLFPPIPLPAPVFVVLFAAFSLYAGISGSLGGIAHFAHLGGLAGGVLVLRHWRQRRR